MKRVLSYRTFKRPRKRLPYPWWMRPGIARRSDGPLHQITVEVRTDAGAFMRVSFSFDVAGRN